jgi:uncharacterized protein (UPF0276 family)
MNQMIPHLGLGVGWRPELALAIDRHPGLGFVEVMAEDLDPFAPVPASLKRLRLRDVPLIPHGVTLSLGGVEPIDRSRVAALGRLATRLGAPLVSEHLSFVRAAGLETGHLLPLPRTREMLEIVIANVRAAQQTLPVPLALENVACLFEWPHAEMDEATFLAQVLEGADVLLLLDVENVYANARNHGWDPLAFLDRLPLGRLAYVHVAGGIERQGLYHDTHAHPIPHEVLALLEELCARVAVPGVMLERDDRFPDDGEFLAELAAIAHAVSRGAARREASHAHA